MSKSKKKVKISEGGTLFIGTVYNFDIILIVSATNCDYKFFIQAIKDRLKLNLKQMLRELFRST